MGTKEKTETKSPAAKTGRRKTPPAKAVAKAGEFDSKSTLAEIQDELKEMGVGKRRSKMDPYRSQIMALDAAGAKPREINHWLKTRCNVQIAQATVYQYVVKSRKK